MQTREVVFVDYARSAFGKQGGAFKDIIMSELGGYFLKKFVEKTGILERGKVDGVIAGSAHNDPQTLTFAKYIAQLGGLPFSTSGTTVEMQCGSGITSINHAAWKIAMGAADVIIAGGAESCSSPPVKMSTINTPYRWIPPTIHFPQKLSPFPEEARSRETTQTTTSAELSRQA